MLVGMVASWGGACATPNTICGDRSPDGIEHWERQMVERGRYWGQYLGPESAATQKQKLVNEFYDSANSFYLISDYLGEREPWLTYAESAVRVYRDGYLIPIGWKAAGWRRSSQGLYQNYLRGGDVTVQQLVALRDKPAFSNIREGRNQGGAEHRSRAIALAVQSHVHAERAGAERKLENGISQLSVFVKWMGSHLYEWRSGDYRGTSRDARPRFAPFMFGMTAHALIEFYEWELERGEDPNRYWLTDYPMDYGQGVSEGAPKIEWLSIPEALADVATWAVQSASHDGGEPMWGRQNRGDYAFLYQSIGEPRPAYGLNLMIAHVYGWLWKETGDPMYRKVGDRLFTGGALNGGTSTGKHFNQQYRMAFDYLKWRAEGDRRYCSSE